MATAKYSISQTIVFDEEDNHFETFMSLYTEMMVTIGTVLCSFSGGKLYTHDNEPYYNNFFGVQYDSYITAVFNKQENDKKTFTNIEQIASQAWACPEIITGSNEYQKVKQISNLIETDFEELEGNYNTAFLQASNSLGGLINGSSLKGNLCSVQLKTTIPAPPNNLLVTLAMVTVRSINSTLNER